MSTRKLIAVALACGLAILLAGGIQLVLLAGRDDPGPRGTLSDPGTAADVDGLQVRLDAVRRVEGAIVLEVAWTTPLPGDPGELARGWVLFAPDARPLVPAPEVAGLRSCDGATVPASDGVVVACDIAFAAEDVADAGVHLARWSAPGGGSHSWRVEP